MNKDCRQEQERIALIRQYLSSKNISSQEPINSILDVEASLNEFQRLNGNSGINDDEVRNILCQEALRLGMILHFGKVSILEKCAIG